MLVQYRIQFGTFGKELEDGKERAAYLTPVFCTLRRGHINFNYADRWTQSADRMQGKAITYLIF